MRVDRGLRTVLCLTIGCMLIGGLLLLLGEVSGDTLAAPAVLFALSLGAGTACTQAQPCSLQVALAQASGGEMIYVGSGIYTGPGDAVITLTKSVRLYGGWNGAPTGAVMRDPDIYPTVLDGEGQRRGVYIGSGITPTLDGFIIAGGNAGQVATEVGRGGGIYGSGAGPILVDNLIVNNIAHSSSTATGYGGGIYLIGASALTVISDNLVLSNTANTLGQGKGGGITLLGSAGTVHGNVFRDNVAGARVNSMGGGLAIVSSPVVVHHNLIEGNRASSAGSGFGGGLYSQFGDLALSANSVVSNGAQYGALTFESNRTITVTNNLVARNGGGGVLVRGTDSYRVRGTLAHNTVAGNGGEGVYVGFFNSGYVTLVLTNNIVASHTTGLYCYPHVSGTNALTATHTLFHRNGVDLSGSVISSTGEINGSDPLFVDPDRGDYRVLPRSPAVDAGTPIPWVTSDLEGQSRPNGLRPDIGADEAWWLPPYYLPMVRKG